MNSIKSLISHTPLFTSILGIGGIVKGASDCAGGKIFQGIGHLFWGSTAVNLGMRCLDITHATRQSLTYLAMQAGLVTFTFKSFIESMQKKDECSQRLFDDNASISEKFLSTTTITKPFGKLCLGVTAFLYCIQATGAEMETLHHASLVVLPSCLFGLVGIHDLMRGNYVKGSGEMLLATLGIATAAYYIFKTMIEKPQISSITHPCAPMSNRLETFYHKHEKEIDTLYSDDTPPYLWNPLGRTSKSKKAFTHPDLPNYVIKVARPSPLDSDLQTHVINMQSAKELTAQKYPNLVIPDSHLVETASGSQAVFEEKITFLHFFDEVPETAQKQAVLKELSSFGKEGRFCDLRVQYSNNAVFLKGTEGNPKIGIFDLDCVKKLKP